MNSALTAIFLRLPTDSSSVSADVHEVALSEWQALVCVNPGSKPTSRGASSFGVRQLLGVRQQRSNASIRYPQPQ